MGHANLPAALAISASWLAHGGMPPFSGFLAKMLIFNSLVSKGEIFLVLVFLNNLVKKHEAALPHSCAEAKHSSRSSISFVALLRHRGVAFST